MKQGEERYPAIVASQAIGTSDGANAVGVGPQSPVSGTTMQPRPSQVTTTAPPSDVTPQILSTMDPWLDFSLGQPGAISAVCRLDCSE